ncbi:DUF2169 domain-containing protein [bacterium]|nr:DUF2169 domain-containing protein [candidate division CSSED10-310 bacterium]
MGINNIDDTMNLKSANQPSVRLPVSERYDAYVGLSSDQNEKPIAFAIIKLTYRILENGNLKLIEPVPLHNNIYDPAEKPRLKPGCDFWPYKMATDIVVQGKAHALAGKPVREMDVSIEIGNIGKTARVTGNRNVTITHDNRIAFTPAEPFTSIDLTYYNAYGGVDWRVPVDEPDNFANQLRLRVDHPGMYPRNPYGCGYVVLRDQKHLDGIPLPNIEHPRQCLSPETLFTGQPELWYQKPLPWCFDWLQGHMFPRSAFFGGADGWYPAPENDIPEIHLGILPVNYRSQFTQLLIEKGPHPRFFNEASLGLQIDYLNGNEPVRLKGMSPDGNLIFHLPGKIPELSMVVESKRFDLQPSLYTVLLKPDQRTAELLWGSTQVLPRRYIPGIHKDIPVACSFLGDPPLSPDYAEPVRDTLLKSQNDSPPVNL